MQTERERLLGALDHIAKTAALSRTSTRRLRWIEARARGALDGRPYSDLDIEASGFIDVNHDDIYS